MWQFEFSGCRVQTGKIIGVVVALGCLALGRPSHAEDWGAYSIVPASGRAFVLEAVGSGTADGTPVSIGKPIGAPNQKWVFTPRQEPYYTISPLHAPKMVVTVAQGGRVDRTPIILAPDAGQPWQEWELKKLPGGLYRLVPRHAAEMGLDHFAGKQKAGTEIDLYKSKVEDQHLQWLIEPLAGTLTTAEGVSAESPDKYVPPQLRPEDVPVGEIKQFHYNESKIFPGTNREVTVFIPAQYDGSKPACVYVKTDGFAPAEKGFLETMIAARELPVMIGVFVRPGELPATIPNTGGRRNRCFEYDAVADNNVRFLVDELLPYVAKKFDLKLSSSGNDRCICGVSSGGIAAFNAAFQRPDAFSRVYAVSGSFVAFRGGQEYSTLIRKFEAQPIRAYLTTGTHDMENCAGDWFLIDQEIDKALKFSGYDYKFRTVNGGHGAGYHDYWHEAMSYLWREWPKLVAAGPSAPRVRDVILPDENWQLVSRDFPGITSSASNPRGEIFFVCQPQDKIFRIDLDGKIQEFLANAGQANGLSFGKDGDLFTVSTKTGKLMRYDATGHGSPLVEGLPGRHVQAMPGGGLYVTANEDGLADGGTVWYVKDGNKVLVDRGLKFATGLAFRPDQWLLAVADGHSKWAFSYQINPDGTLTNREKFFWLHVPDWEDQTDAEAVCYSKEGQMFVATNWGIQVCTDDGPNQVILPMPDRGRVFSISFGGAEFDTLFAFTGDKIYRRKVKVHGIGAFSPWTPARGLPL